MRFADLKHMLMTAAIYVNDSPVAAAQTTISDPTGNNDNEVVRLAWTDQLGMPCGVNLTEKGVAQGVFDNNRFVGFDNEGDLLRISFNSPWDNLSPTALETLPPLQVSLDGGVTFVQASEVRIVLNHVDIPGEDGRGQLHLNVNPERVIYDVWTTRDEPLDHNIGTRCDPVEDLVCGMVFEAA